MDLLLTAQLLLTESDQDVADCEEWIRKYPDLLAQAKKPGSTWHRSATDGTLMLANLEKARSQRERLLKLICRVHETNRDWAAIMACGGISTAADPHRNRQ